MPPSQPPILTPSLPFNRRWSAVYVLTAFVVFIVLLGTIGFVIMITSSSRGNSALESNLQTQPQAKADSTTKTTLTPTPTPTSAPTIAPTPAATPAAASLPNPASGGQFKTLIKDEGAKQQLLGPHPFSIQWIGWDYFGKVAVKESEEVLRIKGTQKSRTNTDYVTIDGVITEVDAKIFKFEGTIITRISDINGGRPCKRTGKMTFAIKGDRTYWRLQQMLNPCTEVDTDYIDIFFRE